MKGLGVRALPYVADTIRGSALQARRNCSSSNTSDDRLDRDTFAVVESWESAPALKSEDYGARVSDLGWTPSDAGREMRRRPSVTKRSM